MFSSPVAAGGRGRAGSLFPLALSENSIGSN
jgi:hypothetical protein